MVELGGVVKPSGSQGWPKLILDLDCQKCNYFPALTIFNASPKSYEENNAKPLSPHVDAKKKHAIFRK